MKIEICERTGPTLVMSIFIIGLWSYLSIMTVFHRVYPSFDLEMKCKEVKSEDFHKQIEHSRGF